MSAESPAFVRSFPVGHRTVTLTIRKPVTGMVVHSTCEWSPDAPRSPTQAEIDQYRAGRNAALEEFARLTGLRTLLVEI